jgi:hypothetical protein
VRGSTAVLVKELATVNKLVAVTETAFLIENFSK